MKKTERERGRWRNGGKEGEKASEQETSFTAPVTGQLIGCLHLAAPHIAFVTLCLSTMSKKTAVLLI